MKRASVRIRVNDAGTCPVHERVETQRLDPCRQIAKSVGYQGDEVVPGQLGAAIAYREALEDELRAKAQVLAGWEEASIVWAEALAGWENAAKAALEIASQVPREDEWRSAADFMQHAAETLDIYGVARPDHYPDEA